MNHMVRKVSAVILAMLLAALMIAPAVLAEDQAAETAPQTEQAPESEQKIDAQAEETAAEEPQPAEAASEEAAPEEAAAEEAVAEEEVVPEEPQVEEEQLVEEPEAAVTDEPELVEIQDEQIPLAGGAQPNVSIRANRDLNALRVGDKLVLTAELTGFDGMETTIRWQAKKNGEWTDLKGENGAKLTITITEDNANWAYRVAVDVQPAA